MKHLSHIIKAVYLPLLFFIPFVSYYAHAQENLNYPASTLPSTPIERVLSAGRIADVLLVSLVPEKMVAVTTNLSDKGKWALPQEVQRLENIGRIAGRGATAPLEKVLQLHPNVIIDVGNIDPTFASTAQRVQEQTGIPYVLIQGGLENSAQQLRQLGQLLGVKVRSEKLADLAQRILTLTHHIDPHQTKIYFARSADGLETGLAGSIHAEVIDWIGAKNVADVAGKKMISRISMEQLLQWQPDMIITQDVNFYQKLQAPDSLWQSLSAVKNKRIYLVPNEPFGWLDQPPSINRLLGCLWLAHKLSPQLLTEDKYISLVNEYFHTFYHYSLTAQDWQKFKE